MRKYWYRRILIMLVVFAAFVGGSYCLIDSRAEHMRQEVNADMAEKTMVIPGGMPVGIYLETDGVMVLGTEGITGADGMKHNPAAHLVKSGDYIAGINGQEITSKAELVEAVAALQDTEVILEIKRDEENRKIKFRAVDCGKGEYKLGIWVRDNAQGLGTVTYLSADSSFGALGHGIHDVDTNDLLDISSGTLYITSIKDIQKGENGIPGGMEGIIVYNNYNVLGTIEKNTDAGIFGKIERIDALFSEQEPMETAAKEEVQEGPATIRCAVEGEVKEYDIQITGVDTSPREINKALTLEVTDEELLKAAGGIVQGMSGSPIIQNGKLVGAVTHVFVNNPTKGYGIFVETMLNNSK
ncbi:SpoIVB peptidase [Faecalicatena contorta]|uniref:SpoIVB peptidase n=1 Tax=Faecalicatena contorta TaxID=39482 RepID=UPI001F234761|nr:SpoIVB peptidase [Faecalicatena contorta]MCF2553720.1 SpoIVB peptidase [Faecalicatena contorta]